jgi:hypothetical protein
VAGFLEHGGDDVRSEASTASKADKIFSGYQPCQLVKNFRRFREHVCAHCPDLVSF